ncbi:MAG: ATP-dependent DNA helicase RecG [Bacilli bacterium]|nr:ATP-dependent DNA helicase RecG [Bacilli bacterium]
MELENIEGIGPKTKELLAKLQIYNVNDLINHYPFRYEVLKRSNLAEMKDGDKIIIDGTVEGQPTVIFLSPKLKKLIFRINTGTNVLNVTAYNMAYIVDGLKSSNGVIVIGKYDRLRNTIIASDIRLDRLPPNPKIESVYYTTSGLSKKSISRYITSLIMGGYKPSETLPEEIINKYNFMSKYEAVSEVHLPSDIIPLKKARQRLKYEELFFYLLKINYLKEKISNSGKVKKDFSRDKINSLVKKLPFSLTLDQETSLNEILNDLSSDKRMNRLLQGDVGSGKTIIALLGVYANYLAKYQSAIMVPTEILAMQHYNEAKKLFEDTGMNIALLTSSVKVSEKKKILEDLENGNIDLIVGTQSLIQDGVIFNKLGFVVTDEQHRFGVNQRCAIKNKGDGIDVLSMSATPIPRTYALTIYGDMDISSIKTKPIGRKDVITYYKRDKDVTSVLELMKKELDLKHQIYVIAPMISSDDDNDNEIESVKDLEEKMSKAFGKIAKIGSIHGKLETEEKNKIMKDYESGKLDILISTTVIEVGVNVPNASMIVIFDANLFGLSTIHQLRGRVGRSDIQSYCVLLSKEFHERLKMLEECHDGFKISEYDFANRGEGDLFGIRQSGDTGLILANVNKDYQMLLRARDDVMEFLPKFLSNKEEYQRTYDVIKELDMQD